MPIKLAFIALYTLLSFSILTRACPTCVGRIAHDSPPFFTDECYEWQGQQQHQEMSSDTKEHSS